MKTNIDKTLSEKLNFFSCICMVMVIVIHSHYTEAQGHAIAMAIQNFCGTNGLSSIAVPMFFIISGYLFFHNTNTAIDCLPKIKKRVITLGIPYLFWNVAILVFFIIVAYTPFHKYINSTIIESNESISMFLYECLIKPAGFHLWFLRDLLLLVLASPIIYICVRYLRLIFLIIILSTTFINYDFSSILYFSLGAYLALGNYSTKHINKPLKHLLFILSGIYFCLGLTVAVFDIKLYLYTNAYKTSYILAGLLFMWMLYDYMIAKFTFSNKIRCLWLNIGAYSFFIYCFHEPTFALIKKVMLSLFNVSTPSLIILYFCNVLIMIWIAYIAGITLEKFFPKIYKIISGGRGKHQTIKHPRHLTSNNIVRTIL